jgi:hypothetical protein
MHAILGGIASLLVLIPALPPYSPAFPPPHPSDTRATPWHTKSTAAGILGCFAPRSVVSTHSVRLAHALPRQTLLHINRKYRPRLASAPSATRATLPPVPPLRASEFQSSTTASAPFRLLTHPAGSVPKVVARKPDSVKIRSTCTADRDSLPNIDQIDEFQGQRCSPLARVGRLYRDDSAALYQLPTED